uniref:NADH dehydrogenase subunit 4 n=1 Tax=Philine kinglipini TaxID=3030995 RepID=UPI002551DE9D|nr:NADH dehydrogenase subunit 4 [Philine kinglipini]WFG53988.1 NADH dehydrogenase subunit 4 [Philine kinglipini]
MMMVLFCFLGCTLFMTWEVSVSCFAACSLFSIILLKQNFSLVEDLFIWGNSVSSLLILLSCVLCFLCVLTTPYEKSLGYILNLVLLGFFLCLAFSMSNMILFYVFFEASLLPTLLLIIGWGYQPERLQAGTYMMLYTVAASLPLFLIMIWWCMSSGSNDMYIQKSLMYTVSSVMVLFILGAFLVKLPMYSVHLWLPKAHVEAPLVGSMILAGILLKLGGYGIFLMSSSFSLSKNMSMIILVAISIWGGLLATFICLRQIDVKALVAYSSVGHMGIVSSGFILDSYWGVTSALITMLAHGFSSSGLFCLAYFTYSKSHTRNMPYMSGLLQLYPILSFWWFLFCCINMAAPPTLNLVGELLISVALWQSSGYLGVVMGLMVFFSAAYNMYLYTNINHGFHSNFLGSSGSLASYENLSMFLHMAPLLLLMKGNLFY